MKISIIVVSSKKINLFVIRLGFNGTQKFEYIVCTVVSSSSSLDSEVCGLTEPHAVRAYHYLCTCSSVKPSCWTIIVNTHECNTSAIMNHEIFLLNCLLDCWRRPSRN